MPNAFLLQVLKTHPCCFLLVVRYVCANSPEFYCVFAVAPICYAHLAASQVGSFMKFDDLSETSSSQGGMTSAGPVAVPQLPRLQEKVSNSMFFCWEACVSYYCQSESYRCSLYIVSLLVFIWTIQWQRYLEHVVMPWKSLLFNF